MILIDHLLLRPAIAAWLVVNFWIVILAIISMFFIMIPMLCVRIETFK